jgi:hypothetical protein
LRLCLAKEVPRIGEKNSFQLIEIIMKFSWKEICGKEAVAKLNTNPRRGLQYPPHIYLSGCLPTYFCGFSKER